MPLRLPMHRRKISPVAQHSTAKLNVTSVTQAHNLVKFSNYGRYLGNGLVVIDFGSRIGNVQKSYKTDGDWERDLFIELLSFATSAIAGTVTVNVGSAALGFIMVATPVGWVGLIVAGAAIVGAAAAIVGAAAYGSMEMNSIVKEDAGDTYDTIMNSINPL